MAGDLNILSALKARMQWHQSRQQLLSENVANANSVGYQPRDLKSFESSFQKFSLATASVQTATTNVNHMPGSQNADKDFTPKTVQEFETVPSGNSVNLEDEMTKLAENQMDYQSAITLYTKSLNYLKIALGTKS